MEEGQEFSGGPAAAAAKSLQSCPILCDPIVSSPPGSPVPGILQARILEWVAISFLVVRWLRSDAFTAVMQVQYPIGELKLHKPFGATKEKSGGNGRVAGTKGMDLRSGPNYKGTTR